MSNWLPIAQPDLNKLERENLIEAFDSGWISSSGKFIDEFESQWSEICQTKYTLAVSNGTVALHLILKALEIGPGDEVILPSMTFISCANAITYVGAKPVFADVEIGTWGLDPLKVNSLITNKTKAIMAVHLYGFPADMRSLRTICDENSLFLIEDSAEAPFAEVSGKRTGSLGDVASFSFYGNKIITCGEGGAVTTSDIELYKKMKQLRGQGLDPERRYFFPVIGFNFRLTNLQCAILVGQIANSTKMIERRREIYNKYDQFFRDDSRFVVQELDPDITISPWLYTFVIKNFDLAKRDKLIQDLNSKGIETRPIFIPIHTLPPYINSDLNASNLDITEFLGERGLSIPTFSGMRDNDIDRVVNEIGKLLN
jgi:perosamine synthetase